jgi:ribose transport system permease protein
LPDTRRILQNLSFGRIGVIYVWLLEIVIFTIIVPSLFPTADTVRAVLNNYSISGLAALAVLVPMVSGAFDASIGGNISLSSVTCAYLLINTHLSVAVVVLATLGVGLLIGLANVLTVVVLRIPSLIGTLAVWLIADALSIALSGNQNISSPRVGGSFGKYFSQASWGNVTIPVLFVLVLMVVLGTGLTQTTLGRYTYAVGFDPEVTRLAGIRVRSIQAMSLLVAGLIGAFAGIVLTAHVSSATPGEGDSYLLPAFAAVFLGATQFRAKRFNAVGTVLAVFMLGTGQYGLVLAGGAPWTPNIFQGVALIAAIGFTHLRGTNQAKIRGPRRKASDTGGSDPASDGSVGDVSARDGPASDGPAAGPGTVENVITP